MGEKIKVLVVDDSAIVRDMLLDRLSRESDIEVIGTAPDPFIARDKIVRLKPDVITLDIEMPRMDGLTFLEKLMTYYPMPVIMVSSVTTKDPYATIKALEIGAFDVVNKPGGAISVSEVVGDIIYKIRQASLVKDHFIERKKRLENKLTGVRKHVHDPALLARIETTDRMIAIGASTGGTQALEFILKSLPLKLPPILITQHMPPLFTRQFAERLNELSVLNVKEAEDDELITSGSVYIAKGGIHMGVERRGAHLFTKFIDTDRVHFQKPAVDVMFGSIAEAVGKNVIALLLTGMGKDGAEGLLRLKECGAYTMAQDEASSVVWGMPRAAIEKNAHREVVTLEDAGRRLVELAAKETL